MRDTAEPIPQIATPAKLLTELLAHYRAADTGILEAHGSEGCVLIYLKKGTPVFAETGIVGQRLGEVLARQGKLSPEQNAHVIARMTDTLINSEMLRFGEVAVSLGYITLEDVDAALREQVRARIVHCLCWSEVRCVFRDDSEAVREVGHYPSVVEELLREAVEAHWSPKEIQAWVVEKADTAPLFLESDASLVEKLRIDPHEYQLLEKMDGSHTLRQHLDSAGEDRESLVGLAFVLSLLGEVDWLNPSNTAPTEQAAGHGQSRQELRDAPSAGPSSTRASKPLHSLSPERLRAARELKRALGQESSLSPPGPDPAHLRRSVAAFVEQYQPDANQLYRSAQRNLQAGNVGRAISGLHRALKLDPNNLRLQLSLCWARYRAADAPTAKTAQHASLLNLLAHARRSGEPIALAYHIQGQLAFEKGDDQTALNAFRRACRVDPNDIDSQRYLRILQRRKDRGQDSP